MTPKDVNKLSVEKTKKLEKLIDQVESRIKKTSSALTKAILKGFLDKLKTEKGKITSGLNKTTTELFNKAWRAYLRGKRVELVKSIVVDLNQIMDENHSFYKKTVPGFQLDASDIKRIVNRRLGLTPKGNIAPGGYMSGLLEDQSLRATLQKEIFKDIFKGVGYEDLRSRIQDLIEGNEEKLGAFERHYKTFSFDAYAQLNAFTSGLYSQKLGLTYFIYNGGLIETSREFCIKRNAGIYSTEEAEQWVDDPDLTAIPDRDTYNWLIDRGGYNCRHGIDFIADEVAFVLRPDLAQ